MKITTTLLVFLSAIMATKATFGQTDNGIKINSDVTFEFRNDTLYSNTGLKFFQGQKLLIGTASSEDGHYRSIIPKKAAIVPSIWGQDKRYDNAIENYVDSKKNREKLKDIVIQGQTLTVKRIAFITTGRPHFYMVFLYSEKGECKADIKLALTLGELILQQ